MRLLIVGVGQTLNFETKEMEDVLQVMAPDGSVFSVPTTNEAARELVKLAMNGNGHQEDRETRVFRPERGHEVRDFVVPDTVSISGETSAEVFPSGAEFFGGDVREQVLPAAPARGSAAAGLGRSRNSADRSGVPSYGIARVDERGNPVLPAAPSFGDDDEDDPGEQA